MHTVIILSRHSSDLLKDFRFLFKPFMTMIRSVSVTGMSRGQILIPLSLTCIS